MSPSPTRTIDTDNPGVAIPKPSMLDTLLLQGLQPRAEVKLTSYETKVLEIVTRTASALSALGVIAIIASFCLSRHFRNPMHRLIFINAFYNAFDVTCTMISTSGPKAGNASALCQFQAFLNQMHVSSLTIFPKLYQSLLLG